MPASLWATLGARAHIHTQRACTVPAAASGVGHKGRGTRKSAVAPTVATSLKGRVCDSFQLLSLLVRSGKSEEVCISETETETERDRWTLSWNNVHRHQRQKQRERQMDLETETERHMDFIMEHCPSLEQCPSPSTNSYRVCGSQFAHRHRGPF